MVVAAAIDSLKIRDVVTAGAAAVLITAGAEEAVNGPLAPTAPTATVERAPVDPDPVLLEVGEATVRLSDARAQGVIRQEVVADDLPPAALFEIGLVDEAADQIALARIGEERGIDEALEIRAQLALARRRILSSAVLDLEVRRQVTDEAVRAAYDAEVDAARAAHIVEVRRLVASTEDEALALKTRIENGASFAALARRHSVDAETAAEGGLVGQVRLGDLPANVAATVADLPVGVVSAPVAGTAGWTLLMVEARAGEGLPPFEVMEADLRAAMRADVVAETVNRARNAVRIRLATTAPIKPAPPIGAGTFAASSSW